jgi:N-methylhydantoinase B
MKFDGISLGIIHSRMTSVADEAAAVLVRTVYSHIIRDAKDFAIGLLDADGRTICQSTESIPVFLGTMSRTAKRLMSDCAPIGRGDIVLTNDPWIGSGHLPDINMLMPVFIDDKLLGYVVVIAHMADIGGHILGTESNDAFEEGLRIPPMWLRRAGETDETLLTLVRANVRLPEQVVGDINAMVNAGQVACKRLVNLAQDAGIDELGTICDELEARGEAAMQAAIGKLRKGSFESRQLVERETDDLLLVAHVDVDPGTQMITVDYEGTSAQVSTGHNATYAYTRAYTAYALKCLFAPSLPFTEGIFRRLEVKVPEGSILNCRPPSAVGGRHLVGQLAATLVVEAMSGSTPKLAIAECGSPRPFITVAGHRQSGTPFSIPLLVMGGFGGRADSDGPSALPFPTNTHAVPVEMLEATAPLFVEEKQLIVDSGGPGEFRGGLGQKMTVRSLVDGLIVSVMAMRSRHPAQGLFGGLPGARTRIVVGARDGKGEQIFGSVRLVTGERLHIESPGGGGYGDPLHRSHEKVRDDVANGYVSDAIAASAYAVEARESEAQ